MMALSDDRAARLREALLVIREAGMSATARKRMEFLDVRACFDEGVRVEQCDVEIKLAEAVVISLGKSTRWRLHDIGGPILISDC